MNQHAKPSQVQIQYKKQNELKGCPKTTEEKLILPFYQGKYQSVSEYSKIKNFKDRIDEKTVQFILDTINAPIENFQVDHYNPKEYSSTKCCMCCLCPFLLLFLLFSLVGIFIIVVIVIASCFHLCNIMKEQKKKREIVLRQIDNRFKIAYMASHPLNMTHYMNEDFTVYVCRTGTQFCHSHYIEVRFEFIMGLESQNKRRYKNGIPKDEIYKVNSVQEESKGIMMNVGTNQSFQNMSQFPLNGNFPPQIVQQPVMQMNMLGGNLRGGMRGIPQLNRMNFRGRGGRGGRGKSRGRIRGGRRGRGGWVGRGKMRRRGQNSRGRRSKRFNFNKRGGIKDGDRKNGIINKRKKINQVAPQDNE